MAQTRIHPVTGKELTRSIRVQTVSFGALSKDVEVPGWYPDDESDSIHSGADLEAKEQALSELRKAYGMRVRETRKKLGLTQVEAGTIVGGGPRAFQKYERGIMTPSDAAVGLLEVLREKPDALEILKTIRKDIPSGRHDQDRDAAGVAARLSRRDSIARNLS